MNKIQVPDHVAKSIEADLKKEQTDMGKEQYKDNLITSLSSLKESLDTKFNSDSKSSDQ